MTITPFGWAALNSADTLAAASWSTTLLSLANGASSVSPAIDNTTATVGGSAYTEAVLQVDLGASTALGSSGTPSLSAVIIDAIDGVNYMSTFVSSTTLYPLDEQRVQQFPASSSVQRIVVRGLFLRPVLFKVAIINNLGVAFPASGVAATLYRMRLGQG